MDFLSSVSSPQDTVFAFNSDECSEIANNYSYSSFARQQNPNFVPVAYSTPSPNPLNRPHPQSRSNSASSLGWVPSNLNSASVMRAQYQQWTKFMNQNIGKYEEAIREIVAENPGLSVGKSNQRRADTEPLFSEICRRFPQIPKGFRDAYDDFAERIRIRYQNVRRDTKVKSETAVKPVCKTCVSKYAEKNLTLVPVPTGVASSEKFQTFLEGCREENFGLDEEGGMETTAPEVENNENDVFLSTALHNIARNKVVAWRTQSPQPEANENLSGIPEAIALSTDFKRFLELLRQNPEEAQKRLKAFCEADDYKRFITRPRRRL